MVVLQHWLEIIIDYRLESVGSSDVILSIIFKDVSLLIVSYMYYFFYKIA